MLLVFLAVYYLAFYPLIGVIFAGDSYWYMRQSIRVSPGYPLLISLFRHVFLESHWATALVLFQELLTAYAVFTFANTVKKLFTLSSLLQFIVAFFTAFMYYAFRLLIIGKETDTFFCNTILTEGITYPLFILLFKYLLLSVVNHDRRLLPTVYSISFIITLIRGQFFWIPLFLVGYCFYIFIPSSILRKTITSSLLLVSFILLSSISSMLYHYHASGTISTTTLGTESTLTAVLYDVEQKDIAGLSVSKDVKNTLLKTIQEAEQEHQTSKYAPKRYIERYRHYEDNFDLIRKSFMNSLAAEAGKTNYKQLSDDELSKAIAPYNAVVLPLAFQILPRYLRTRCVNFVAGLIRSNSLMHPIGIVGSILLYFLAVLLLVLTRNRDEYRVERSYLLLILLMIVSNALFCAFGVFALSRYMYYGFPLFYLSFFLYAVRYFKFLREKIQEKES
ncbi:MAG: hypothetical protein IJJ92_04640 [Clostridia bacterium]|nr:hypothetical protein [Clostridia bacterium]